MSPDQPSHPYAHCCAFNFPSHLDGRVGRTFGAADQACYLLLGRTIDPAHDQENPPAAEPSLMCPDPMMVAMLPAIFFSAHHGYFGDGKVARAARTEWPKPDLRSGDLRPSHKPPEDDGSGPIGIE